MELMKEFHTHVQESLELESNNRKSEGKIHYNMITDLSETLGEASNINSNTAEIRALTERVKSLKQF
jgi:polyhydroxyalkanoate synthesis regulator phasin